MSEYTLEVQKKETCYMPTQRTFSRALLFLKGIMLCGKNIPIVFRVYKTRRLQRNTTQRDSKIFHYCTVILFCGGIMHKNPIAQLL